MRFIQKVCLLGLIIISHLNHNLAQASTTVGELELSQADQPVENALLLSTAISGEITGMIASISIDQRFQNTSDDWVNGRYVFPLPEGAAVDSLEIKVGERVIKGVVKPREEAKKTFEAAKKAGKKAGLLAQHRPNLFSMSVANIGPLEFVTAKITFVEKVKYESGEFSLTLPTTLTPRYIPGAPIKLSKLQLDELKNELEPKQDIVIGSTSGWAKNTDLVPDASLITPPQSHDLADQNSHQFSLSIVIDAGMDLQQVVSDTHMIIGHDESAAKVLVSLANGTAAMHKDLELRWQAIVGAAPKAAVFQQELHGEYYSMLLLSPPQLNSALSLPRDTTFIIDSSGSMAGGSMQQARQALLDGLAYLNSGDRFNVIDFDSDFRALFEQSQAATAANLARARTMINALVADGGTEMKGALQFALNQPEHEAYLRQIVFITDGAIGNETELFNLIDSKLHERRLFTIGIGSAPNSYFMSKAAKHGRGSYTYIRNLHQVQQKMAELFSKISKPQMRNIDLDWQQKVEQFPARIPDLYAGEPISVLVKSAKPITRVTASGELLGQAWQQAVQHQAQTDSANLDTVWARAKVGELMDQLALGELETDVAKQQISALGVAHSIVTKFTSLVAVEEAPSKPIDKQSKHNNVPNLMPSGSTMPIPQTATPATLLSLLGASLMVLSMLLRRRQTYRIAKRGLAV